MRTRTFIGLAAIILVVFIVGLFALEDSEQNLIPTTLDEYRGEAIGNGCVKMDTNYIEYLKDMHGVQPQYEHGAWYVDGKFVGYAAYEDEPIIICKE